MKFNALILLATAVAPGSSFSGDGHPIDGDSLRVGQQEVRLFGIDAPELNQTCAREGQAWHCGSASAEQLSKLVAGRPVTCIAVGTDRYGRTVARCNVGSTDINRYMVATGFALAYRRYSLDYISAEDSARVNRRGIWSSTFQQPSDVRHSKDVHELINSTTSASRTNERPIISSARSKPGLLGNCRIKGNRSRRGEWIYHLPGMPYYEQTVAEEMFCTEAEARAAGYRRSRADQHR